MAKVFQRVGSLRPGKSVFDLSYVKKFTCDMGQLIPVMCDEVVPGDYWKIGNQAVVRFQPLVAPIMHEINMYVHYFFVPYRLLDENWENFITGGIDGEYDTPLVRWEPTENGVGSLWDYLGFPVDVDPDPAYPTNFPRAAYNFIYNNYYTDETLIGDVSLDNELILNRCWEKDYFTSSLPWQQRGTSPALPISGTTHALWADASWTAAVPGTGNLGFDDGSPNMRINGAAIDEAKAWFNNNTVDLSVASTFDIADLRLAFQVQKWMERNARAGNRYVEFLQSHFSASPRDSRLQRPEYIGGTKCPIIISEVLQTSSTDATSPQGNLAGHGITASSSYAGSYRVEEFGLIMGLMSIMPRTAYQQGIDRQWLRETKYDYYFPEFANLSEQAITKAEICVVDGDATHNADLFGYQGRYDEMRIKRNMVCGLMRTDFDYWHLGRIFDDTSSLTAPELNEDFVKCVPRKDIFAVTTEPGLIVEFGNAIKAFRPMPLSAEPGLIDHN